MQIHCKVSKQILKTAKILYQLIIISKMEFERLVTHKKCNCRRHSLERLNIEHLSF